MTTGCVIIGEPKPQITLTNAFSVDAYNVAVHTYTGLSFGAADASRFIIVGVCGGTTLTNVTIGGVTATAVGNISGTGIFIAALPTGTTGTVVVTLSSATFGVAVCVCGTER